MTRRKQTGTSKGGRSPNRTKQTRMPVGNNGTPPARKPIKPALSEPFHVAVDRQLKSGHENYEAAERAALKIKSRYPQLLVTIFDAREGRHKPVEQPRATNVSNKSRTADLNGVVRPKAVAASKH